MRDAKKEPKASMEMHQYTVCAICEKAAHIIVIKVKSFFWLVFSVVASSSVKDGRHDKSCVFVEVFLPLCVQCCEMSFRDVKLKDFHYTNSKLP